MLNSFNLRRFCMENNASYEPMWRRIALQGMQPEDALKDYLNRKQSPLHHWYKYTYGGMTLKKYCDKNRLPYDTIIKILNGYYKSYYTKDIEEAVNFVKQKEKKK